MPPTADELGVVVVTAADTPNGAAEARALDGHVRGLVLCGTDAAALGALGAELSGRAVCFVGDPAADAGRAALVELVDELFARE
jgi:hypothetical protein